MPVSDVTSVTFQQEYFLGDPPPFFSSVEETQTETSVISIPGVSAFPGYPYTMDVPASPPNPDRILTTVTLQTESGTDSDGIVYGGNFRPITQDIGIVGLTDPLEQAAARTALTVTAGSLIGNTVTDQYSVNTFGLASLGISEFGYIIPYREQDIDIPGGTRNEPFIQASGTGNLTYSITPDDPRVLSIQTDSQTVIDDVLEIENISIPGVRNFDFFNLETGDGFLRFDFQENTFSRKIFEVKLDPDAVPFPREYDNSSLDPSFPRMIWGLFFDNVWNSVGLIDNQFRVRAYSTRNTGVDNLNQDFGTPIYGRIWVGKGLAVRWSWFPNPSDPLNREGSWQWRVYTSSNSSNRRTVSALLFVNNSTRQLTVECSDAFNYVRVSGLTNSGGAGDEFDALTVNYFDAGGEQRNLGEVVDELNAKISAFADWNGAVFSYLGQSGGAAGGTYEYCAAEYLLDVGETPVAPSGNTSFAVDLPEIANGDPDYTFQLVANNQTFRWFFDIRDRFFEQFGERLNLPIGNYETNMPDSWLDWPDCARLPVDAIQTFFVSTGTIPVSGLLRDTSPSNQKFSLYYRTRTPNSQRWSWADLLIPGVITPDQIDTIQDFCDFYRDYNSDDAGTPFLSVDPGLYYGSVDVGAIIPTSGSWTRTGIDVYDPIPEGSGTFSHQIIIRGGQSNIGGSADFPTTSFPGSQVYPYVSLSTISQLAAAINILNPGLLEATVLNGAENISTGEINFPDGPFDLAQPDTTAQLQAEFDIDIFETYNINDYGTIEALVGDLQSDWSSRGISFTVLTGTNDRPDAVPSNLNTISPPNSQDLSAGNVVFSGQVSLVDPPDSVPEAFVYLDYKLNWVGDVNPGIDEQGIQVALGGYKDRDGEFFINPAPNAFFEPGFNTLFDATFSVTEADEIYIIVRTRQNVEGDTFTSNPTDYQGLVRFSNGFPSQVAGASAFSGSPFDVWADSDWNGGNVPAVISVSAEANIMTLFADDTNIIDSIQVQINNFPAELDEFAFLALNRTNQNASMTESQNGRVFGLVLDNRGIWDVLIGPESEIQRVIDGEFDYLNFSFNHETIDSDEAYNFEFFNIDPNIANSVDLIPVPGFPRVAVLRISAGVKRYLSELRAAAPPNSLDGCSVDIDILAEGRESSAQGIARVTVFADYRCVYDIGLCDFFWNLTDPPSPEPPDSVENTIEISYTDYIDCDKLDVDSEGDNARISFPLLITFQGVPVFENANSLLLIKGTYSESVEGYYFPPRSSFANIQNPACDDITDNEPLSDRLNQEILFLEGVDEPITNTLEISRIINAGVEPYLYIKPQFQFPGIDSEFECGPNEVVIAGIGYQTRDWEPGLRQDDILIGVNSVIANSSFSAPEIEFCYKFYYRRES